MKKRIVCCIMTSMLIFSLASCGSKKTTVTEELDSSVITADKGYERETTSKNDKESKTEREAETEIYLENTSGKEVVIKDDSGKEIKLEEGETLAIKEKTTDAAGDEVYVLESGATVKVESVTEAAKEKTTVKQVLRNTGSGNIKAGNTPQSTAGTKTTTQSTEKATVRQSETQKI